MVNKLNLISAVGIVGVLLLTCFVYWSGLDGPFLLDDLQNIQNNYVDSFETDELVFLATHNTSGVLGRPISVLTFAVSGIFHGPEPWGYKYHNLLIHLLNGLLIFWLLIKLLPKMCRTLSYEKVVFLSGVVSACWLVHPLMVSTVLYAVQRMTQLSALFTLLALLSYVFCRENVNRSAVRFYSFGFLCFPIFLLLAMFSKENGALLPCYVFAVEFIVYQFAFETPKEKRRIFSFLLIFVFIPIAVGAYYILGHSARFFSFAGRDFTVLDRLLTQLHVVPYYVKLILLPRLADMSLFHDDMEVIRQLDFFGAISLLVLLTSIYFIFALRKKAPVISFGIAWFLISHLMESTVFNLEMVFEHRNYIAAIGPMLAVLYYLLLTPVKKGLMLVPVLYFLLLIALSITRVHEWSSEEMFFTIAVTDHPESTRAHTQFANIQYKSGYVLNAREHLRIAQELEPQQFGAVVHEILYTCHNDESLDDLFDKAMQRAVSFKADSYSVESLNVFFRIKSESLCPEASLEQLLDLVKAASRQESNRENARTLSLLQRVQGRFHLMNGEYKEAVDLHYMSYATKGEISVFIELANFQIELGRFDDAEVVLAEITKVNDENYGVEDLKLKFLRNKLDEARASIEDD